MTAPLTSEHPDSELRRLVAAAIFEARYDGREGPYEVYDYSEFNVPADQYYAVRDFRYPGTEHYGRTVFATGDYGVAFDHCQRLCSDHVAAAAIEVVRSYAPSVKAGNGAPTSSPPGM